MLHLEYSDTDFDSFLSSLVKKFSGSSSKNNSITLNSQEASGYIKGLNLPENIDCIITNTKATEEFLIHRKASDSNLYVIILQNIYETESNQLRKSIIFLSATSHDWMYILPANCRMESLSIYFPQEFITEFLGDNRDKEMIEKYLALKQSMYNYTQPDERYEVQLQKILNATQKEDTEILSVHNAVRRICEVFFLEMLADFKKQNFNIKINNEDLKRIEEAENVLVKDFTKDPPSINDLASIAAMSPSKFKTAFREIYGQPVYQHFQKQRMNKAKSMLMSKKYSVREVGMEIGFTNFSNFAKAFKKTFDQLPSDL